MTGFSFRRHSFLPRFVPLLVFVLVVACDLSILLARDRLPLQKKKIDIGQPAPVAKEFEGYDKNGNPIYWDPQPHVVPFGDGKYAFKWMGHSGRELTLVYERPDVVDVIVEGSATEGSDGHIRYVYKVRNLRSSKQNLGGFDVQTYSPGAKPERRPGIYATDPAHRRKNISAEEGQGIYFAPLGTQTQIRPAQDVVFVLTSPDPPGIVECRAHADTLTMKGVGEEPPSVLEDLYLRRDAWPHGYTIGPDERLGKMPLREKVKYLT